MKIFTKHNLFLLFFFFVIFNKTFAYYCPTVTDANEYMPYFNPSVSFGPFTGALGYQICQLKMRGNSGCPYYLITRFGTQQGSGSVCWSGQACDCAYLAFDGEYCSLGSIWDSTLNACKSQYSCVGLPAQGAVRWQPSAVLTADKKASYQSVDWAGKMRGNECTFYCDTNYNYNSTAKTCVSCPSGSTWNPRNNSCVCSSGGHMNTITNTCSSCSTGQVWDTSTNSCSSSCQPGQNKNTSTNTCVAACASDRVWDVAGNYCKCPSGGTNPDGSCVVCPSGKIYNSYYSSCVDPPSCLNTPLNVTFWAGIGNQQSSIISYYYETDPALDWGVFGGWYNCSFHCKQGYVWNSVTHVCSNSPTVEIHFSLFEKVKNAFASIFVALRSLFVPDQAFALFSKDL